MWVHQMIFAGKTLKKYLIASKKYLAIYYTTDWYHWFDTLFWNSLVLAIIPWHRRSVASFRNKFHYQCCYCHGEWFIIKEDKENIKGIY